MKPTALTQTVVVVALICAGAFGRADAQVTEGQIKKAKLNCAGENLPVSEARLAVDANTGRTQGSVRYPSRTQVQVVVTGKNPFKYSYRTDITASPLEESIAKGFFEMVVDNLKPVAVPVPPAAPAGGGAPPAAVPGCNPGEVARIDAEAAAVVAAQAALDALLDARIKAFAEYTTFFDLTDGTFTDPAVCAKVVDAAAKMPPHLTALVDAGFLKAVEGFAAAVRILDASVSALQPPCNATNWATNLKKSLEGLKKKADQVNGLVKAKTSIEAMHRRIETVFASDYPFQQAYYAPVVGQSTGVVIKTYRTNLRLPDAKEEQVATVNVQIGESAVSVSMGFGMTNAADIAIGRRPAFVPSPGTTIPATSTTPSSTTQTPATETTIGNRLGYIANSSGPRPVILTMLNARLPEVGPTTRGRKIGTWFLPAALSTGVAFRIDGSTKGQTEWVPVALGWNLGSDHVLLTVGLHMSRIDVLDQKDDDGNLLPNFLKIGDPVPATLADPLPLGRGWDKGFMVGVTFKTQ